MALASLEKAGRIDFMITQNVDRSICFCHVHCFKNLARAMNKTIRTNISIYYFRLHHRAGSNPLELHGTVYNVSCLDCGFSVGRNEFQDHVKAINPKVGAFDSLMKHQGPQCDILTFKFVIHYQILRSSFLIDIEFMVEEIIMRIFLITRDFIY